MANTIQLRRSATANAVPTTSQLALGELAINTYDGKLYLKKNVSGVETIVDVTGSGGASISISDTAPSSPVNGSLWWNSTIGVLKIYYNDGTSSQWVDASYNADSISTQSSYPQNIQSGSYTLALSDAGKHIYSQNTGSQTITIPTYASVPFPIGSLVTIVNMGTTKIVLSFSGVTIIPNGTTTGLSTAMITPGSSVQLMKTATNTWNATFGTITANATVAQYLMVAGGGGGGGTEGGGGGAGGLLSGSQTLVTGTTYTITVGAGGAGQLGTGSNGSDSTAFSLTAVGGGGGGHGQGGGATNGGSGGGAAGYNNTTAFGLGIAGQGNNGGSGSASGNFGGGGGGGAGGVGQAGGTTAGGNGGVGLQSSITGTATYYAGGGGGGIYFSGSGGTGGLGGGANGGNTSNATPAPSGTANTGGGGGGGANVSGFQTGGTGGSGVIILSIPTSEYTGVTTGSPTITTSGSNTILKFTSSGTYTA